MGYGSVEFREVGQRPIYDDEFSFDHRGGFGAIFDVLKRATQPQPVLKVAPTPTGVSPGAAQVSVAPVLLPAPTAPPVSAQTTVGPPVSPTVAQNPPVVVTGTDGGGTTVAQDAPDGGFGTLMKQAENPFVIGGLLVLGLLALRRSGGTRRWL